MHLLLAVPTPATHLVCSIAFIDAPQTLDTPTHLSGTNNVTPLDMIFHDTSFFGSPCEDPAPALVLTDKSRSTRRGTIQGLIGVNRHGSKGFIGDTLQRVSLGRVISQDTVRWLKP